ncbi:hypothetical protein [Mycolicibacterium phlei]
MSGRGWPDPAPSTFAAWDAAYGSWSSAIASAVYLAALLAELFWWPRQQARLVLRAEQGIHP